MVFRGMKSRDQIDFSSSYIKKESLAEVKDFLRENISREFKVNFGLSDTQWIERATVNWFNDQSNYDGRWSVIRERIPQTGKVLDMAAGCGTFVLFGLQRGYDVWGVEPESWKRVYLQRKVIASGYPENFLSNVVDGVGEALPFADETFDLVTTYQTLEHVRDVELCIKEMLRVLKPEGILYIKAPDYNCFFEPHYRVPFLPKMNKGLAAIYLRLLGRPTLGLRSLQWVTEKGVVKLLRTSGYPVRIERTAHYYSTKRQRKIRNLLPKPLRKSSLVWSLNLAYELKSKLARLTMVGREERDLDLWVTKGN